MPSKHGTFKAIAYRDVISGSEYVAMVCGNLSGRRHQSSACIPNV